MPLGTTTPSEIRRTLASQINALTPSTYPEIRWSYRKQGEIRGEPRTFTIRIGPSIERRPGFHGTGSIDYEFDLEIEVAYGGLAEDKFEEMRDGDSYDLTDILHPSADGGETGINGLLPVSDPLVPIEDVTEEGFQVVVYTVTIPYNRAVPAPSVP